MFRVNVLASLAPRWRRELWETVRSTGTSAMHRLGVAALLLTFLLGVATFLAMISYWRQEAGGNWSDARNVSVRDRVRRLRRQRRIDWSACHVLLTGGSRGIGLEVAKLLVSGAREAGGMAPARLTIVGRNMQRLEEAKTTLELLAQDRCQSGGTVVHAAAADVSQPAEVERLFREAPRPFDVVICCAGGARPGHFEAFTAQDFSDQMAQNFYSAALVAQAVFRQWKQDTLEQWQRERRPKPDASGRATDGQPPARHVVLLSSMAAMAAIYGYAAYAPAKYAVRALGECLVYEGRPYGITVSVAYPPDTDTPGLAEENVGKPLITRRCSEASAGPPFSAARVARALLRGVTRKQFWIVFGLDGYLLGALNEGFAPRGFSLCKALLMPILRCSVPFYMYLYNRIIDQETEHLFGER
ncbi:hypothetical protein CDCA_CDCA06G1928 [Cyanidium caldarium]|uniref:Ketoreductase domain-containing protein n=1 Tax=Cyanidium caldarium TaxID=2771 RepID=A0AAV9IUE7_CYACA|nr:hypothetical protein CDCA_CDCA06G1928 [Cyanidium caldarium]